MSLHPGERLGPYEVVAMLGDLVSWVLKLASDGGLKPSLVRECLNSRPRRSLVVRLPQVEVSEMCIHFSDDNRDVP